jgi:hypothetical protein
LVGGAQKVSSIIKVSNDSRISIWLIGIIIDPYIQNDRINFNRIDVANTIVKCMVYVVSEPRADDQFIPEWLAARGFLEQVNQGIR